MPDSLPSLKPINAPTIPKQAAIIIAPAKDPNPWYHAKRLAPLAVHKTHPETFLQTIHASGHPFHHRGLNLRINSYSVLQHGKKWRCTGPVHLYCWHGRWSHFHRTGCWLVNLGNWSDEGRVHYVWGFGLCLVAEVREEDLEG